MNLLIRAAAAAVNFRVTAVEKLHHEFDRRIGQAQEMFAQRVYNPGQQPLDSGARRHSCRFFALAQEGGGGVMWSRFAGGCGSYTPRCGSGLGLSAAHGGTGAAGAGSVSQGGGHYSDKSQERAIKF